MTLQSRRQNEKGNILFLILLAVILFAALSYAVTQSLRGGGTDASSEKNLVKSAQITQYPVGVRAAILRMIVGGTDVTTLNFDPPSTFGDGSWGSTAAKSLALNVFHPTGGGAVFSLVPSEALATASSTQRWVFTMNYGVPNIGTTASTSTNAGKDLMAIAPNIDATLCAKIDAQLGVAAVPTLSSTGVSVAVAASTMQEVVEYTYAPVYSANLTDGSTGLNDKPYLCVKNGSNTDYFYYHVLVER